MTRKTAPLLLVLSIAAISLYRTQQAQAFLTEGDEKPALSSHNPLMPDAEQLFNFAKVDTTVIRTAAMYSENKVTQLLSAINSVTDDKRTFANTMLPLDEIYNIIQKQSSVNELISQTSTNAAIRDLSGQMLGKFNSMADELLQNENLYKAVKGYASTAEGMNDKGERKHFTERLLKEFELNGMNLSLAERDTLKKLNARLNDLAVEFGKNIAGDKTKISFHKQDLAGLKEEFIAAFADKEDTYTFDLSTPTYTAFMGECSNTESRKKMYLAKMNIGGQANEKLLVEIIRLRTKKAKLLGFKTYSQYATSDVMSQNTENVWKFEKGLANDLRPKAQADMNELLAIKTKLTGEQARVIYPYESAYYTNELLKSKYNVDQAKVKEYFEISNVINGIFTVYQKLYDLEFQEDKNPSVWFKDVRAFTVFDNKKKQVIGYFYLDLYPRENKYNHFGCFGLTGSKRYSDGKEQMHCAALVCNFSPSTQTQPSLLPHAQVVTFFHEFGHLIHHMLSSTELAYDAGTNVATDFVEAPSQIMENWAWQKNVLSLFAKHYQTGAVIPDSLVNNMIAARNLNSGINTLQQVYYGTLDFTLNDGFAPASADDIAAKNKELQNSITLFPNVEGTHFAGTFGHLTGYGSKYYGYLWSLVYAADMFSEFRKTDPLDPKTGDRYRQEVLSKGGSDEALNLVRNFLGREPNNKAFLNLIGL